VVSAPAGRFTMLMRVPGWAQDQPVPGGLYRNLGPFRDTVSLTVNGRPLPVRVLAGFAPVTRDWAPGDTVDLHLPMPARRVVAHPAVKADEERVAIERGPLVYTAEFRDNGGRATNLVLEDGSPLAVEWRQAELGGVAVVTGRATALAMQQGTVVARSVPLTLIPYYAWAHRGKGEMAVWLARLPARARPVPEATLASASKASSSEGGRGVEGLNEQHEPSASNDRAALYFHWWPKQGSVEWVQYDFPAATTVSETAVYWFDDTGQGGCRTPRSWRALYRSGDAWLPVAARDEYGVAKDRYNVVRFAPLRTASVRLEVQLPSDFSAGIQEWKVR